MPGLFDRLGWQSTDAQPTVSTVIVALIRMSRPDQLLLMVLVYGMGIGAALAWGGSVEVSTAVVGFLVYLPLAASVHYANEFADYETDQLTTRTQFSGGSGALVGTPLTQSLPKHATLATAGVAAITITAGRVGGVLTPPAVGLLVLIGLFGWGYSLEPAALAWRGLGEIDNAALGGIALPVYGTTIVTGSVSLAAIAAFVPFGIGVFCNLLATTWPDRAADAAVGKCTLATQWSTDSLRRLYAIGVLGIVVSTLVGWLTVLPAAVAGVTLLASPGFVWGWHRYTRQESPAPTVGAMVVVAVGQTAAWWGVVYGVV